MTKPERITKELLESFGFLVKEFGRLSTHDPQNTFYMQFPFQSMRLDFALLKPQIVIETQGDYWHGNRHSLSSRQLIRKIADVKKQTELSKMGWSLIEIKEFELYQKNKKERMREYLFNSFSV